MSIILVLVLIFMGLTIWSLNSSDKKKLTSLEEKLALLENSLAEERNARQAHNGQMPGTASGKCKFNRSRSIVQERRYIDFRVSDVNMK